MAYRFQSRLAAYRNRKTKSSSKIKFGWVSAALAFAGAFACYSVLFPDYAGLWGRNTAQFLGWLAGLGRYFLPVLIGYGAVKALLRGGKSIRLLSVLLTTLLFFSSLVFLSFLGEAVWKEN